MLEHYGWKTLLYGTLLPGPHIGSVRGCVMRAVRDAGFEVGLHSYDHVRWQDGVARADESWTEAEFERGVAAFTAVFGHPPDSHAAAGWQLNPHVLALESRYRFRYASDTRGKAPYLPEMHGVMGECAQLPTTLPTLDELIGVDGNSAEDAVNVLLAATASHPPMSHVFTLHAELEGQRLLPQFERLLTGWMSQGFELVAMRDLFEHLQVNHLRRHEIDLDQVPGRSGTLAIQGRWLTRSGRRMTSATIQVQRRRIALLAVLLAFTLSWLVLLGHRALFNPDEGRYAEIPREMFESGNWLVPRLNDLVYIEKPPLQYWATAASYAVFGTSDWSARFYTGLCGLLTVLISAGLAWRIWGPATAWRAGIMSGSSLLIVLMAHQLTLDMSLTFFTTLMLAAFCIAHDSRTADSRRRHWMWLAWAAAAGAYLTKGLVALVLPALTLLAYSIVQRQWSIWRQLSIASGLTFFLLLTLPWMLLMQREVPQFFDFFIVREHFARYLTMVSDRYEPWWFFLADSRARLSAVDDTDGACAAHRLAPVDEPGRLRCATLSVDLERERLRVLFSLGLKARALHPADVSLRGVIDGDDGGNAAASRPAPYGRTSPHHRGDFPHSGCIDATTGAGNTARRTVLRPAAGIVHRRRDSADRRFPRHAQGRQPATGCYRRCDRLSLRRGSPVGRAGGGGRSIRANRSPPSCRLPSTGMYRCSAFAPTISPCRSTCAAR